MMAATRMKTQARTRGACREFGQRKAEYTESSIRSRRTSKAPSCGKLDDCTYWLMSGDASLHRPPRVFMRISSMRLVTSLALALLASPLLAASPPSIEKGEFRFRPCDEQKNIPNRYRLEPRSFTYEMEKKTDLPAIGVSIYRLRFPSPVKSATPENNTVHAEYYRPDGNGAFPRRYRPRYHRRRPDALPSHRHLPGQQRRRRAVRADGLLRAAPAAGQPASADVAQSEADHRRSHPDGP